MFSYQVMTESEAMQARYQLLKEGIYDAIISASVDKVSSSGNPMMDMTVSVYDENGKSHDIRDFLVFTEKMTWKAIHCAESAGIFKEFEEGKFCSDIIRSRRVKVKIGIQEGGIIQQDKLKGSPLGSKYPDKNKIEDYLKESEIVQSTNSDKIEDDQIPF